MGYSVGQYRVALTLFSSVIASLGGWLYALQTSFVFIDLLGLNNSTNGLVYALVGGVDTILGPLVGAAVLRALTEQLSRGTSSQLYVGIVLMLVVYFLPDGLVGLWRRYRASRLPARQVHGEPVAATPAEPTAAGL
jgi:branched-chain amino acid transport system permease protein